MQSVRGLVLIALCANAPACGPADEPESRRTGRLHEFTPQIFHNAFATAIEPVLRVSSGDSIHTTTIDATGTDEKGIQRATAGNPQTGPFYVEGVEPGDTVAIHLTRLRLNRDWAVGTDTLSNRAITTDLAARMTDRGRLVRWHLDIRRGVAVPEDASANLAQYAVPLAPMLGGIALAPANAGAPPHTGEFGVWGGNLDFNEMVEGTTVYLPARVPGGLLYIGDAHAAQGDGELSNNGLETSMDVTIRVERLPRDPIPAPRVESSTHLMALGLGTSLDEALPRATTNMIEWLMTRHSLTFPEVSQVLGTSAEYTVSVIVGQNAGIAVKIRKDRLRSIRPR